MPIFTRKDQATATANITDNAIVRGDGGAKGIQGSGVLIDDSNEITGVATLHVTHTASENDDHALEIDANAAGFADVKALDIDYITGALAADEDEAVILINIDETSANAGVITGLEVLATEGSADAVNAIFAGAGVGVVEQLAGAFIDVDSILNKVANVQVALSGGGAGNISVFVANADTMTFGNAIKFQELEFIVDTAASGAGIKPTWEYSTGSGTWNPFSPVDGTNGLRNTGVAAWLDSDLAGWLKGTGNEFLIRLTRTRVSLGTTPILDKVQLVEGTEYSWNKDGDVSVKSVSITTPADGNVVQGPSSATDDRIVTFDGTTGKQVQDSGTLIADLTLNADKWSKGLNHDDPTATLDKVFYHTPVAITISRIYGETDTGTVTFKMKWRAEGSAFTGGTEIHATGLVADATGEDQTSGFNDATIPAGSDIAAVASAVAGSPTRFKCHFEATVDN